MDLIRTLGVAIDPSAAKAGGAQASEAFRKVGVEAEKTERATRKTRKEMESTGTSMRKTKDSADFLRTTLERQTTVLTRLDASVRSLTAVLGRKKNAMEAATSSTNRMSEASSRATAATRQQTTAIGQFALVVRHANVELRQLQATMVAMRSSSGMLALPGGGGGGRRIINVTGSAGPMAVPPILPVGGRAAAGAGGGVLSALGPLRGALGPLGVVGGAAGATMGALSLGKTELEVQRIGNALKYASGSAAEFAKNQQFLGDASAALGLDLMSSSKEFAKFAAAAKGSAFTADEVRDVFLSVAKAGTVLGLSADDMGGALNALQQMISKGNVQAEELRQQLGERLPGAFQFAAAAMGVTTKELNKMLDRGDVTAHELLPALARELNKAFGPSAASAAQSLNSELNRMRNAWTELKKSVNEAGFADVLENSLAALRAIVELLAAAVRKFQELKGAIPDWMKLPGSVLFGTPGRLLSAAAGATRPKDAAARQANILTVPDPVVPAAPPPPSMLKEFIYRPTARENLQAGIGLGVYEEVRRQVTTKDKDGNDVVQEITDFQNRFTNMARNVEEAGTMAIESLHYGFSGLFDDLIAGTGSVTDAFRNMASSILADIARIIARQAIINPIVGAIGGALGIKPTPTPVSHTGGLVGVTAGLSRLVSPSLFAGAPKLHSGLAPDEFPAILQRGEEVVPKGGSRGMAVSIPITVHVDGRNGGSPEQNQAFGAEIARQIEGMVDERIARAIMPRGILAGARA